MNNEQYYDEMDEFYCRDLVPLSTVLDTLMNDGNRYHFVFATMMQSIQAARWLVKPATGWIDKAHEDFFNFSWQRNSSSIIPAFMAGDQSGHWSAKVYDPSSGQRILFAFQPYAGWMSGARDVSREKFERWWLSGAGLRASYHSKGVVGKVAWADKLWAFEQSNAQARRIQVRCPGWRADDGSKPELGITGAIA